MKASFISLATALSLGASLVQAAPSAEKRDSNITPITVKGNAFFKGKDLFYMLGVDYQPGGSSKLYVLDCSLQLYHSTYPVGILKN